MTIKTKAQIIGQFAEEHACRYLSQQGLQLIARNYRCRLGEIDLIFVDKDNLVFVEVRYRKSSSFGTAADTVDYRKQQKLIKAATYYIQAKSISMPCRFDVVAVAPSGASRIMVEWIKDAFQAEY